MRTKQTFDAEPVKKFSIRKFSQELFSKKLLKMPQPWRHKFWSKLHFAEQQLFLKGSRSPSVSPQLTDNCQHCNFRLKKQHIKKFVDFKMSNKSVFIPIDPKYWCGIFYKSKGKFIFPDNAYWSWMLFSAITLNVCELRQTKFRLAGTQYHHLPE